PDHDHDNDGEIQKERQQVCLMHAQTGFPRQPSHRGGVLQISVLFLFCSGGLAGFLGEFSADGLVLVSRLAGFLLVFRGCGLGSRRRGLLLRTGSCGKRPHKCQEHERQQRADNSRHGLYLYPYPFLLHFHWAPTWPGEDIGRNTERMISVANLAASDCSFDMACCLSSSMAARACLTCSWARVRAWLTAWVRDCAACWRRASW